MSIKQCVKFSERASELPSGGGDTVNQCQSLVFEVSRSVKAATVTLIATTLVTGVLVLGFGGCGEKEKESPAMNTSEAQRNLEAIKRINLRELKAAEASGDSRAVADAKVRATQRLAEASREIGDARVQETLDEVNQSSKEVGRKLHRAKSKQ